MKKINPSWVVNEINLLNGRTDTIDTKNSSLDSAGLDAIDLASIPKKNKNNRRISELHHKALMKGNFDQFHSPQLPKKKTSIQSND